jgi:peroxiredoxin Q/BCP
MLQVNDTAPNFTLPDQDETEHTLADFTGTWKVIYFYPKDDTPGCTKEACAIRDIYNDFEKLGVKVFGVSKDTPAKHKKFAEKYELPFTLLSDPEAEMLTAYGAMQEKSMYGKSYLGIQRMSYLINPDNKVAKVYPKVSPTEHALELLSDVKELQASQK